MSDMTITALRTSTVQGNSAYMSRQHTDVILTFTSHHDLLPTSVVLGEVAPNMLSEEVEERIYPRSFTLTGITKLRSGTYEIVLTFEGSMTETAALLASEDCAENLFRLFLETYNTKYPVS